MELDDLSEGLKEYVKNLKHSSSSIENDVADALINSKDEEEFLELAFRSLTILGNEVLEVRDNIEMLWDSQVTGIEPTELDRLQREVELDVARKTYWTDAIDAELELDYTADSLDDIEGEKRLVYRITASKGGEGGVRIEKFNVHVTVDDNNKINKIEVE